MWGYPGELMLAADGSPIETVVKPGGDLSFLEISVETVQIAAGSSAYFNLGYSEVPAGSETTCPKSSSLEITPPNDTQQVVVPISIEACQGGLLSVSPVFGSSSPATATTAPPS